MFLKFNSYYYRTNVITSLGARFCSSKKYVWKTRSHFLHGCFPAWEWQFNKTDDAQPRPSNL